MDQDQDNQGLDDQEEDEIDEEEVIDTAEQIFYKIVEAIVNTGRTSIREAFEPHILQAEIDGQVIELLEPMGLLDGIKDLGVDDLTEKEVACLLRVLTKPELEGAIEVGEFIQIMENLGMMG